MWTQLLKIGVIALGLLPQVAAAQVGTAAHASGAVMLSDQGLLLDGVRAFRSEHYAEALGIFQKVEAERQPRDIGFYLGMALHKLGRHAEALPAFRSAHRAGLREPVADYYQALSCYRMGMLARARRDLSALVAHPSAPGSGPALGPRLQLGAGRFLQAIEQAAAARDPKEVGAGGLHSFEAALLRAEGLLSAGGKEELALEWLDESVELLAALPERDAQLPALRKLMLHMREALSGKPAEADVLALWARVGAGSAL